jgi:triphosphoribosyl-dephospho-CoA synthetase
MNNIAFMSTAIALAAALGSVTSAASAQSNPPKSTTVAQADASCEKTVRDYVNVLRYVKQTSGNGIAGHVEQAYISEAEIMQIAQQQGYCGAAQALKAKGVTR